MKKIDFTTTLRTGEVLRGTAEYDREYWLYSPYDYARVQLTGTKSQLYFSRDLVSPLGAQGALSRSENLLVDTLDEQGRAVERQFADLSGGLGVRTASISMQRANGARSSAALLRLSRRQSSFLIA